MRLAPIDPWQTPRLNLRAFRMTDICTSYLQSLNDPTHMRFSRQRHLAHNHETATEYLSDVEVAGGCMIASLSRQTGHLVATVTMRPSSERQGVEMGILTLREFRGTGIGLATWQTCLDYLRIHEPSVRVVLAGTHRDNTGMKRILAASGFLRMDASETRKAMRGPNEFFRLELRAPGANDEVAAR